MRQLHLALDDLPFRPPNARFGEDIDLAHRTILSDAGREEKEVALRHWLARSQPCLFGRMAMRPGRHRPGPAIDFIWVDAADLEKGDAWVTDRVQAGRIAWKERAIAGKSSGCVVMFNDIRLAYARPSLEFVRVCERLADFYFPEQRPVCRDLIYTESVPLHKDRFELFKGSSTLFATSTHETILHDHRVPGGVLLNFNAVGHYANVLASRPETTFAAAVDEARELAFRSVGNGGIGSASGHSCTWHLADSGRPHDGARRRPSHVPAEVNPDRYAAEYHTDVLIPSAALSGEEDCSFADDQWPNMLLDYLTDEPLPPDHHNYALMRGHAVPEAECFSNPWGPLPVAPESPVY